jgi:spoIIIJ-associated protein
MKLETTCEGPTVEEALDTALEELGVQQDVVEFEVIEEPSQGRGLFGRSSETLAKVHVRIRDEYVRELEISREEAGHTPDEARESVLEEPEPTADEPPRDVDPAESAAPLPAEDAELTDDELDQIADAATEVVEGLLGMLHVDAEIEEYEGDEGEIILDIVGADLGILIGRHGRTLDAMQTVVSAITHRKLGRHYPLLVDVEGYRARRRVKLEEIAHRAAEKAAKQDRTVKLRPMNSYERRVVHIALREDARVTTASEGEEPFRQVTVAPR